MDDNIGTCRGREFASVNFEEVDVTEAIFTACDVEASGYVTVSCLIAYMTKEAGSNPQNQEIIMKMESLLDPDNENVAVDRQTFMNCLSSLVEDQKQMCDGIPVRESPDGQSPVRSPNHINTNSFDIFAPLSPYLVRNLDESYSCGDTSIMSNSVLVDELNEKLAEKNQEIRVLENENANLKNKLKASEAEYANLQYEYDTLSQKYVRMSEQAQQVSTLKAERAEIRENLISMEGQSASYFEQLQSAQRDLRKLKRDFTKIEALNKDLISDVEQLSNRNDNLLQEKWTLHAEIKRLRSENESNEIENMKKADTIRGLDITVQNLTADKKLLQEINSSLTSQIKTHEESLMLSMMEHDSSKLLSTSMDSGDGDILQPHVASLLRGRARFNKSHPSLLTEISGLESGFNRSCNKENVSHSGSDQSFNSSFGSPASGRKVSRYIVNSGFTLDKTFIKSQKDRALISRNRAGPYNTSTPATGKKLRFSSPRKLVCVASVNKSSQTDSITTCDSNDQTYPLIKNTQTYFCESSDAHTQTMTIKSSHVNTQTVVKTSDVGIQSKMIIYSKKRESSPNKFTENKAKCNSVIKKDKSPVRLTPVVANIPRYCFTSPKGTRYASFTTCSIKRKRSIQSQTNTRLPLADNSRKHMSMATTQTENCVSLLPCRKRTRHLSFPQESKESGFVDYASRFLWLFTLKKQGLQSDANNGTELDLWLRGTLELENIRLRQRHGQSLRIVDARSRSRQTPKQRLDIMEPDLVNALPSTHRPAITSTSVQRTVSLEERQRPGNATLQEEASRRMSEGGLTPVPSGNGSDTDSSSSINPVDVFPSIPDTLLHQLGLTHDKDRPPASETLTEQDIEDGKTRVGGTVRRRTSMNQMLSGATISESSVPSLDSPDCHDRSNGLMDDIKEVAESRRESGASEQEYNSSKFSEENNNSKLLMDGSMRRGSREQSEGMMNNMDTFEHDAEDEEQTDQDLDNYFDDQLPSCGDALGLLAQYMATWALQFKEHVIEPYVPLDADVLSRYMRYFVAFLFVLAAIWIVGSSFIPSGATASESSSIFSCWTWKDLVSPFSIRHYEPPPT